MKCFLSDIKEKEIINIKTGQKIGYVDDVEIDTNTSQVLSLIIYGMSRFFGFFGREEDVIIKCEDIQIIGEDTILVTIDETIETSKHSFSIENLLK